MSSMQIYHCSVLNNYRDPMDIALFDLQCPKYGQMNDFLLKLLTLIKDLRWPVNDGQ